MKVIDSTNLGYLWGKIKAAFFSKDDSVTIGIDSAPTENSNNLVTSGGVYNAVNAKYTKPSGGIPATDIASGVIPTVPTISTNIKTDKASDVKTASPKAVYDEVNPAIVTSQPNGGFLPGVVYDLGTLTGTVTFALASPSDATVPNPYHWTFETGSTAPSVNWPNGIIWPDDFTPDIDEDKHYEILVRKGYASMLVYSLPTE